MREPHQIPELTDRDRVPIGFVPRGYVQIVYCPVCGWSSPDCSDETVDAHKAVCPGQHLLSPYRSDPTQGRRPDQRQFSENAVFYCFAAACLLGIGYLIGAVVQALTHARG